MFADSLRMRCIQLRRVLSWLRADVYCLLVVLFGSYDRASSVGYED
jgi:hypothetical protein